MPDSPLTVEYDPDQVPEEPFISLFEWWNTARSGRAFPDREEFDPFQFPRAIPDLAMIETSDQLADFRYRVYGENAVRIFQEERTGMAFSDVHIIDHAEEVMAGYWSVFGTGQPNILQHRTVSDARNYIQYKRLLLPLGPGEDTAKPKYILAIFAFSDLA